MSNLIFEIIVIFAWSSLVEYSFTQHRLTGSVVLFCAIIVGYFSAKSAALEFAKSDPAEMIVVVLLGLITVFWKLNVSVRRFIDFRHLSYEEYRDSGLLSIDPAINAQLLHDRDWRMAYDDELNAKEPFIYLYLIQFLGFDSDGVRFVGLPTDDERKKIIELLKKEKLPRSSRLAREAVYQIMRLHAPHIPVPPVAKEFLSGLPRSDKKDRPRFCGEYLA